MYVSEVFKVASGRVVVIDNIGLMLQGVNTVGLHEKLCVEISSALAAHCGQQTRLYGNCNCRVDFHLTQVSIMDVGMTAKIQRCVPVAMQYPLCTFSRWKAAPESKQQLG